MDISVVIVSYGTYTLTCQAVRAVIASETDLLMEVVIVDNCSPDNSGTRLKNDFSNHENVRVIQLDANYGFAYANNVGADQSSGDVLFFLNSDTIVEPSCVQELYHATTRDSSTGVVGPHVLNEDGSDQQSIVAFPSLRSMFKHYLPLKALSDPLLKKTVNLPSDWDEVDIVKGCALALRRSVFDEIGRWDERYFLYSEETELCYQAQKHGYTNRFTTSCRLVHLGGASTSQQNFAKQQIIQQASAVQFLRTHGQHRLVILNRILGTVGFGFRWIAFSLRSMLESNSQLARRQEAARVLFWWFLKDYSG